MTLPPLKAEKYWRTENICSKKEPEKEKGENDTKYDRQYDERAGFLDSEFAIRLMNTLTSPLFASMNRKYLVLKSLPPKTQHGTHHFPE